MQVKAIAKDTSIPWRTVIPGEGAKRPIIAESKITRIIECRDKLPRKEVCLYIRKYRDGRVKYSLCNAPAQTPVKVLNKAAAMRWPIERCFEECKDQLNMDHYETRSWPAWHRHMLFVFIAHLFTIKVRMMFKKNSNFNNATGKKLNNAAITGHKDFIRRAISETYYHIKRDFTAYMCHRKRILQQYGSLPCLNSIRSYQGSSVTFRCSTNC